MGAQYEFYFVGFGSFFLRGGYRWLYMDESEYGLTLGCGLDLNIINNNRIKIDYAYKEMGIFGNTMTYSIGMTF